MANRRRTKRTLSSYDEGGYTLEYQAYARVAGSFGRTRSGRRVPVGVDGRTYDTKREAFAALKRACRHRDVRRAVVIDETKDRVVATRVCTRATRKSR